MSLKRTPLFEAHLTAKAQMVDFGGWEMPVRYIGDKAEHQVVRENVGLFDVSHMGEVFIEGAQATQAINTLLTNDARSIVDGQAMYAGMLNDKGTFVDDVVAYRYNENKYLVVINAGNREKDVAWITDQISSKFADTVTVRNESNDWGQLALQGRNAETVLKAFTDHDLSSIGFYHFAEGTLNVTNGATSAIIARTGYTGEDGFELYVPSDRAADVWQSLVAAGVQPCGLACRDTLRLEAGMSLYGNDIDETTTPLEASLSWIVKMNKEENFNGKSALLAQKEAGLSRRLRGLVLKERGIARHGYPLLDADGQNIGEVTSGTMAPHLGKAIAIAYVAAAHAKFGTEIFVEVRGRKLAAEVVKLPFYKRSDRQ
jgi:aminomethyltransferase